MNLQNKTIKIVLSKYLDEIEKQMYVYSFKQLADDPDIVNIAEEGIECYMKQLITWDEKE